MKNLSILLGLFSILLLSPLALGRYYGKHLEGLANSEYERILPNNVNKFSGKELENAAAAVITTIVRKVTTYPDEDMTKAIVPTILRGAKTEFGREEFKSFMNSNVKEIESFRDNVFSTLLRIYDVEVLMEDLDIAAEVYKTPDIFGLTYAAYQVLTFQVDGGRDLETRRAYDTADTTIERRYTGSEGIARESIEVVGARVARETGGQRVTTETVESVTQKVERTRTYGTRDL